MKVCSWLFITDPVINWPLSPDACSSFFAWRVWKTQKWPCKVEASSHVSLKGAELRGQTPSTSVLELAFDAGWSSLAICPSSLLNRAVLNIHCNTQLFSEHFRIIVPQSLFRQPLASFLVYVSVFSWDPGLGPQVSKATTNHETLFIALLWGRTKAKSTWPHLKWRAPDAPKMLFCFPETCQDSRRLWTWTYGKKQTQTSYSWLRLFPAYPLISLLLLCPEFSFNPLR
jgi:hypothetical protein